MNSGGCGRLRFWLGVLFVLHGLLMFCECVWMFWLVGFGDADLVVSWL